VVLLALFCVSAAIPNLVLRADSLSIVRRSWSSWKRGASGSICDTGHVPVRNFDWLPFTPPPFWSPSLVLQLVSEPVWSLVGFNRLCDPKATRRKVLLSLSFSMARISVIGRTKPATIS
jgi:hypothetical protein